MKVLVIGGTSFIGKYISERANADGHEVTLFNRGKTKAETNFGLIKGDVNEITHFKQQILEQDFDVAVHCIAYTEKHAEDIVEIFGESKTQLIVLGSCDCYEAFQGLNRKLDKAELPVTEKSELSRMKYYWSDGASKGSLSETYDKNLMTDILMKSHQSDGLNVTVFRLGMIYGPHDPQYPGRHGAFIHRIKDKKRDLLMTDREQSGLFTHGYVENIAAAVVHSFGKEIVNGKCYNLGEEKTRSRRRWVELYSKISGHEFDVHVLPEELEAKDKTHRNAQPMFLLIDNSLYEKETGFVRPVSLEEGVKRTLNYALEHPECLGDSPDYEWEEKLVKSYYAKMDEIHAEMGN